MNKNIVTLKVVDICGPHCVDIEDGECLNKQILPFLQEGINVCLDFTGVVTLISSFLNASIGKLFGQFKNEDVEKRIRWIGLDEEDTQLIKLVIRNAKEHFAKSPATQEAENNIVLRAFEKD